MFLVRSFISKVNIYNPVLVRAINTSSILNCNIENLTEETTPSVDPSKDRSRIIPVETSLKYLKSAAYNETYGDKPVWVQYRRNFKGAFAPKKTRRTCIRKNVISTGNPCPICRDEYLVLSENNPELLKQFICPHTGSVLSYSKTGLCQKRHTELLVCVARAKDRGILTYDVPFRKYNYELYDPNLKNN